MGYCLSSNDINILASPVTVQSQLFLNPYSTKYTSNLQRSYLWINTTLMLSIQVLVDFGKVKYVRNIYSNVAHQQTF